MSREVLASITTFFAMAYIIIVNPVILCCAGMAWGAVFLATIIAAVAGTLIIGLYANVPIAQAPGVGLATFLVYTICDATKRFSRFFWFMCFCSVMFFFQCVCAVTK